MRIIGPPSAPRDVVASRLTDAHQRFRDLMFPALWKAALDYSIDPVGVVAQAYKETGAGKYGGQVKPEFYNTGGIKVRHMGLYPGVDDYDNPLAHQRFASWEEGAIAHAQHVRAYTGWAVPDGTLIVSPRYWLVLGITPVENWGEFGGYDKAGRIQWAPSETYGAELAAIMRRLQGVMT